MATNALICTGYRRAKIEKMMKVTKHQSDSECSDLDEVEY